MSDSLVDQGQCSVIAEAKSAVGGLAAFCLEAYLQERQKDSRPFTLLAINRHGPHTGLVKINRTAKPIHVSASVRQGLEIGCLKMVMCFNVVDAVVVSVMDLERGLLRPERDVRVFVAASLAGKLGVVKDPVLIESWSEVIRDAASEGLRASGRTDVMWEQAVGQGYYRCGVPEPQVVRAEGVALH